MHLVKTRDADVILARCSSQVVRFYSAGDTSVLHAGQFSTCAAVTLQNVAASVTHDAIGT